MNLVLTFIFLTCCALFYNICSGNQMGTPEFGLSLVISWVLFGTICVSKYLNEDTKDISDV